MCKAVVALLLMLLLLLLVLECVKFQKISIAHTKEDLIGNSKGEGVFRAITLKEKFDPKLEFLRRSGWGFGGLGVWGGGGGGWEKGKPRNSPVDIFWNNTMIKNFKIIFPKCRHRHSFDT